jgi:hypothetical protein
MQAEFANHNVNFNYYSQKIRYTPGERSVENSETKRERDFGSKAVELICRIWLLA